VTHLRHWPILQAKAATRHELVPSRIERGHISIRLDDLVHDEQIKDCLEQIVEIAPPGDPGCLRRCSARRGRSKKEASSQQSGLQPMPGDTLQPSVVEEIAAAIGEKSPHCS
jgi:hypothetical protein